MAEHHNPPPEAIAGHELRDLDPKKIAFFGVALAAVIVATLLASYALFHSFYSTVMRARPKPSPLSFSREPTPEPRLSVNPGEELKALHAEETKLLEGYEWIDRERGIVRIPIERAVELIAQRGLPVRDNSKAAPAHNPTAPPPKGKR